MTVLERSSPTLRHLKIGVLELGIVDLRARSNTHARWSRTPGSNTAVHFDVWTFAEKCVS
jgi:hypothetical protein